MLSLEECRKIDPVLRRYSDEELVEIRDALYNMAELALDTCIEEIPQSHLGSGLKTPK